MLIPSNELDKAYFELKRLARMHLSRERSGHTLQPTALVHEFLLRINNIPGATFDLKAYFPLASSMMRRILIDHARSRTSRLANEAVAIDSPTGFHPALQSLSMEQLLTVDDALNELAAMDPRQAQILEMRFFGGLTTEEIAQSLDLSSRTIKREWTCARAWLLTRLQL